MTAMLHMLVLEIADELHAEADTGAANDDSGPALVSDLSAAGLLDIPELIALLLRRAEQEQIAGSARSRSGRRDGKLLQTLVSDENASVSAAAMALILARGRRQDRFARVRLEFDDVPASAVAELVFAVAAGVARSGEPDLREAFADAARQLLRRHDPKRSLDAVAHALALALHESGRLDDAWLHAAAEDGEAALLAYALAVRSATPVEWALDAFHGGSAGAMMLLFRLAEVSRDCTAALLAGLGAAIGVSDPAAAIARFDAIGPDELREARARMQVPAPFAAALAALERAHG